MKISRVQTSDEIPPCANEVTSVALLGQEPVLCPALHGTAQMGWLDLAAVDRQGWVFAHEAGDDVGTAWGSRTLFGEISVRQINSIVFWCHYKARLGGSIAQRYHNCFSPRSAGFDSQHSQKHFRGKIINVAEVNLRRWLVESGRWLENVDWTSTTGYRQASSPKTARQLP